MKFRDLFIKPLPPNKSPVIEKRAAANDDILLGVLNTINSNNYTESKALKLSAVYRSINIVADSVSVLELQPYIYKENWKYKEYDNLYYLLNVQPNQHMSSFTFKRLMVQHILLKGNAYIFIDRDKNNNTNNLYLLNPDNIDIIKVNDTLIYFDKISNKNYAYEDIIHIMNYTENGYKGISTLTYASESLSGAYNAETHSNNFFKGGANLAGILRPLAGVNITDNKASAAKEKFKAALNSDLNGMSNSIVVLDAGLEYQSISISPKESQLLESRQFNFLAIAQWFGVPLSKLFDKSGTNYSSSEQEEISFLKNTLQPLLQKIENEFFRKLYLKIDFGKHELKFDTTNLIRLDATTQASYFSQLFNMGALSINEIRNRIDADYPVQNGNRHFVQQNVQPLDNLLNDIKNNNKNNNT